MDKETDKFLQDLYGTLLTAYKSWIAPEVVDDSEDMIDEYYEHIDYWFERISGLLGKEMPTEED